MIYRPCIQTQTNRNRRVTLQLSNTTIVDPEALDNIFLYFQTLFRPSRVSGAYKTARTGQSGGSGQGRITPQLQRRGAGGLSRCPPPCRSPLRTWSLRWSRGPGPDRPQAHGLLPGV